VAGGAAAAQDTPPVEGALLVDDVVVVTASRREERLNRAPATVSVVTEATIGHAPNVSVTDLLRLVPGVNTVQTSARDVNVTVRAATGTLSDSTLVLLDGRSIYQDFFGFVLWDFLPIDSGEIKQIEVIRGPASAVWGANAMTGVINVISKTPRELAGTAVSLRFGQFDRSRRGEDFDGGGLFSINVVHAQAPTDRFAFKVSASLFSEEGFLRPSGSVPGTQTAYPAFPNRGTTQPRLDARADYDFGQRRTLILAGGISGTEGIIHTGLGPLDIQRGSTFKYGRLTYHRDKLKVQVVVNALDADAPALLQVGLDGRPIAFSFENQAYDIEVSNANVLGSTHLLSYGGNYRHNSFELSAAPAGDSRDEGGAYVQDEIFISERIRWIVGSRIDRFDILHTAVLSPRTTLMLTPTAGHTLRLSVNRAFRAPSFVNSFFDLSFLQAVDLGAAGAFHFPVTAVGNEQLEAERLTAYEVGYRAVFGRLAIGAASYVNRTAHMIQFTQVASYTSAAPPSGWPLPSALLDTLAATGQGLPLRFSYRNFDRITDKGVELSLDARLTRSVDTFANYSWQATPRPEGFSISEINIPPAHRVNAGAGFNRGRYFGSGSVSYVGEAFWQDVEPRYVGTTKSYVLVNAGAGVHSRDATMTVAVRANNLFNAEVQQHIFGDVMKRSVTGEVRFAF
jgi:iron complex outermembrane receptor protein